MFTVWIKIGTVIALGVGSLIVSFGEHTNRTMR